MATRKSAVPRKTAAARPVKPAAPASAGAVGEASLDLRTRAGTSPRGRGRPAWQLTARPDAIDFRDRFFVPRVSSAPPLTMFARHPLPVKHQGATNACTGFALSLVVEHLLRDAERELDDAISAHMLYSMARRYDEFPGSTADEGSSLRGALKGWFKHGACRHRLFPGMDMPPAAQRIEDDWWYDAVRRPLGAYYRIDPTQLADMHAALHEVGILYVSSVCHSGWDAGSRQRPRRQRPTRIEDVWEIPVQPGEAAHGGHAFAIVGYNERGFLIQNSWGTDWGTHGYAVMSYADWLAHAMDCWVAQLGVVTQDHRDLAKSDTLRRDARSGKVVLASSEVLRHRELAPFILNMGNNGALSNSGEFRTTPDDVRAIADVYLTRARADWAPPDDIVDVCVYAHGGLVGERDAAKTAARWIPALYDAKVFPVFMMWETDFWNTLTGLVADTVKGVPRTTGFGAALERWWNRRLERALARPGTALWGEMKQNADAISLYRDGVPDEKQAGAVLLYQHFKHRVQNKKVRMHFVGHSAGSIVGCWMLERLAKEGMRFDSCSLLAPAVRCDTFTKTLAPLVKKGQVQRLQLFNLTAQAEEDDPTCGPYRRSLLHLVAESFEGGTRQPILGLEVDVKPVIAGLPNTTLHLSPGARSRASTHGGFDDDDATLKTVLKFIKSGSA
jgi:hypothetical protein